MTSLTISSHDLRAMAAACGSVVVAVLPLLALLLEARPASAFAILMPVLLAVLFLLAGLRLANSRGDQSPFMLSALLPLLGALALVLPEVPGLCLLALVFLIEAYADGLAVERGHMPRALGLCMNLVAGTAVIVLLATLVGALT